MSSKTKIYVSSYKLKLKSYKKSHGGWLLLFDFGQSLIGYSDFLPWVSFGEDQGEKQLEDLKKGKESLRLKNAREIALQDAKARLDKRSLFEDIQIPPSHFLIEDIISFKDIEDVSKLGYEILKIKLNPYSLKDQIKKIKLIYSCFSSFKWRLDFNGKILTSKWNQYDEELDFLKSEIDFIEDPFPSPLDFKEYNSPLFAEDWIKNPFSSIRIIKSHRDAVNDLDLSHLKRVIFTHSFDHPLGQVASAFVAAQFYKTYPHFRETGGFKCFAYEENDFLFPYDRSKDFTPPSGFGLGFQDVLDKQSWERWI